MDQKKVGLFLKVLRKENNMTQEALAEKLNVSKIIGSLCAIFGVFIIVSALAICPNESSWGSIYSIIGGIICIIGIYFRIITVLVKRVSRIMSIVGCVMILFSIFTVSDYISVSQFHQVPRFSYKKSYGEDIIEHKTLFYTVIQKEPGTENECIEIAK